MATRNVGDLLPGTMKKWLAAKDAWNATHPNPVFEVCVYREHKEQLALHAQGRKGLAEVNVLRAEVGLPPITSKENSYRVTWTLQTMHEKRRAVDFAFKMPGPFDIKADRDSDGIPDFEEFGKICEANGLQWGVVVRGKRMDTGHVQDNEEYH